MPDTDSSGDPSGVLPQVITPLESAAIRAALPSVLPAINWIIYATNLDQTLHITKLTTNQLWQGLNAALIGVSIVMVIVHRVKRGNDPNDPAPKIVMRKPAPQILQVESDPESPRLNPPPVMEGGHVWTESELLQEYLKRGKEMKGGSP